MTLFAIDLGILLGIIFLTTGTWIVFGAGLALIICGAMCWISSMVVAHFTLNIPKKGS